MTDRLAVCLPIILQFEGGFADNPKDPGGATNRGVTLNTYSAYLGRSATVAELQALTVDQVTPIYSHNYWLASHADACPPGVDLMVFDAAVNSGVGRSVRWLQQALGVDADGQVGPATLAALAKASPAGLITVLKTLRATFLRGLADAPDFPGWFVRLDRVATWAESMAAEAAVPQP
jgi:lysozyme family protein